MPAGVVGDPAEWNVAGLAHIHEEPDYRLLILAFDLLDEAAHGERVEDLPHRLRVIFLKDLADRVADRGDGRLGAAGPFYRASTIKFITKFGLQRLFGRCISWSDRPAWKIISPSPVAASGGVRVWCHGCQNSILSAADARRAPCRQRGEARELGFTRALKIAPPDQAAAQLL